MTEEREGLVGEVGGERESLRREDSSFLDHALLLAARSVSRLRLLLMPELARDGLKLLLTLLILLRLILLPLSLLTLTLPLLTLWLLVLMPLKLRSLSPLLVLSLLRLRSLLKLLTLALLRRYLRTSLTLLGLTLVWLHSLILLTLNRRLPPFLLPPLSSLPSLLSPLSSLLLLRRPLALKGGAASTTSQLLKVEPGMLSRAYLRMMELAPSQPTTKVTSNMWAFVEELDEAVTRHPRAPSST